MKIDRRTKLSRELYLDLLRVHERLHSQFESLFRDHGLSHAQYNVLRILRGAGKALPCSVVGDRLVRREPDVTRLIDRMEKQGLVTRARCTEDRRVVRIDLSPAGEQLLAELDAPLDALHAEALAHVSLDRLRALRAGLGEILETSA